MIGLMENREENIKIIYTIFIHPVLILHLIINKQIFLIVLFIVNLETAYNAIRGKIIKLQINHSMYTSWHTTYQVWKWHGNSPKDLLWWEGDRGVEAILMWYDLSVKSTKIHIHISALCTSPNTWEYIHMYVYLKKKKLSWNTLISLIIWDKSSGYLW